nr:hypothetical protein [Tanacetum cinerariifolium]
RDILLGSVGSYDWSYQAKEEPTNYSLMAFLSSSSSSDNEPVETSIPDATPNQTSPKTNSSGKRRSRKTCFVCKSVDHLIKYCDHHAKKLAQPTLRNYAHRRNNMQNASLTHKNPQKHKVPAAVLIQSKPVFNTVVRPVSAVVPKIMVPRPRLAHPTVTKSKSPTRRHITRNPSPKTSNSPPRVTVVKAPVTNEKHGLGYFSSESDYKSCSPNSLSDRSQPNGGYHAVPPPITRTFMPPKPDLVFHTAPTTV